MKRKFMSIIAATAILGCVGGLTSCGNKEDIPPVVETDRIKVSGIFTCEVGSSSQLSVELSNDTSREGYSVVSSDETIASVNESALVSGVKEGTVTLTFAFNSDSTIKKDVQFTVTQSSDPSVKIVTSATSVQVGSQITLTADVYNPKNKEVTYQWKATNGVGTISGASQKEAKFSARFEGDERVELTVMVGQVQLIAKTNFYVKENYSSFTAIGTKEEFETTILNGGNTLSGKYYLTADIDLGGLKVDGAAKNQTLSGTLDGNGHSITNFEIVSSDFEAKALYRNSGFFKIINASGKVRNLELSGTINEKGVGWGTGLLVNELSGTVSNCVFNTVQTFNQGKDEWFPFGATVAGILKETAVVRNCVINITGEGAPVNMAIAAYPAGGVNEVGNRLADQTFKINGIYTNQIPDATFGSSWEWGGIIEDTTTTTTDLVFASTPASTYSLLSPALWDLVDNQMPSLKTGE